MLFWFFIIGVVFACILLAIGFSQNSFPMAYMAMFAFLVLGLFMFNSGIEIQTGNTVVEDGSTTTISDVYTTYMPADEIILSLIGNFFIYGSVIGLVMATFLSFKQ